MCYILRYISIAIFACSITPHALAVPLLGRPHLIVADYFHNEVRRFEVANGRFIDTLCNIPFPNEMMLRPDGYLYVTSSANIDGGIGRIYRCNWRTGGTAQVFVDTNGHTIRGFDFGPNGNLYVAVPNQNRVSEFSGATGSKVRDFITNVPAPIAVRFAPDGDLLIARGHNPLSHPSSILRFDGDTGALLGPLTMTGVDTPQNMLFGPNGDLYVANQDGPNAVTRFDYPSGSLISSFMTGISRNPQGLAFLPDGSFLLGRWSEALGRFDAESGALLGLTPMGRELTGVVYVPEPSSSALLLVGAIVSGVFLRWRHRLTGG